ncbi:hypothetical protein VTL71DRAFT_13387 [Oculimacula yallundae]|uniref:ABC transporter n=1 Tax=Oculimacula yallundae TaxID=86028 RepID=A0ABR4CK63_9HELO
MATQFQARTALHYTCAGLSFLFLTISTLIHLGSGKQSKQVPRRSPKLGIILIALLILTYTIEGIVEAAQAFDFVRSQALFIHQVCLVLVWFVVGVRQLRQDAAKYELPGISCVTFACEAPLLALSSFKEVGKAGPGLRLACQLVRLLLLLCLLVSTRHTWLRQTSRFSEEDQPILGRNEGSTETGYGTEPLLGESRMDDTDSVTSDSDDESDMDSEDDPEMRKIRKKRLAESGGWLSYLKDFTIFLPYLIPRKDRKVQICLLINLLSMIINRFLNILIPRQLGIVTDKILAKEVPYQALGIWLALKLVGDECGLELVQNLAKIPIKQFSVRQISIASFNHVMNLGMDFHSDRDSAEVMKAIEQGGALTTLLETLVMEISPNLIDLVVAVVFLYWKFNAYVSLTMLVAMFGYASVEVFTTSLEVPFRRRVVKAERAQTRVMHQAVQGWQTVLYFNKFGFESRRYGESVESHLAADRTLSKRDAYFGALNELWLPFTFYTISLLILHDIVRGEASPGDFVFFMQYWETLVWPVIVLSKQYKWLMADLVGAERLLNLLQTKAKVVDKEGAHDLGLVKGKIEFKNVSFSYDSRQKNLTDINISALPGQTIALVGATGAGKSTIMKLLLRFYDVSSGQVCIDGHDIRDVTLSSLRDTLGVVPQDPLLFNASVMENLRYARPTATDEEVFEACRAAAIHDKIMSFEDQYDTEVGEQGVKLSRGELQRIAIARVFLKDPPVFILDEATSAIDMNTESEIQIALEVLRHKRTTFVIAHRLSTIVGADQILVVDGGKIVEAGSHEELLRKNGRYQSLWSKQIGGV